MNNISKLTQADFDNLVLKLRNEAMNSNEWRQVAERRDKDFVAYAKAHDDLLAINIKLENLLRRAIPEIAKRGYAQVNPENPRYMEALKLLKDIDDAGINLSWEIAR